MLFALRDRTLLLVLSVRYWMHMIDVFLELTVQGTRDTFPKKCFVRCEIWYLKNTCFPVFVLMVSKPQWLYIFCLYSVTFAQVTPTQLLHQSLT